MSGDHTTIHGPDGDFRAYIARPAPSFSTIKHPAIVVLQEIFGVNRVMRDICDAFAAKGYIAICPDLFWRLQPGVDITDQTPEEWKQALDLMNRFDAEAGIKDIAATIDHIRKDSESLGRVGCVGYCLGGKLAFLSAEHTDVDASVSYYGVGLENLLGETGKINHPVLLHIAGKDSFSSPAAQAAVEAGLKDNDQVTIEIYPDCDHAFARPGGEHWNSAEAGVANSRTAEFFKNTIG
jgi:carboxymethylenebutenolidase